MGARARARRQEQESAALLVASAEEETWLATRTPGPDAHHFAGACNSCGEPLTFVWDYAWGIIDIGSDDGVSVYTWIRHPEGPLPECNAYFSRVDEVA